MGADRGRGTGGLFRRPRLRWCTHLKYKNQPSGGLFFGSISSSSSSSTNSVNNSDKPVALVSFPGSGNTWMRYLLQQATGNNYACTILKILKYCYCSNMTWILITTF